METNERTDYRKCPEELYGARKTVVRMWKMNKPVTEIAEATGFSTITVYKVIRKYKAEGMKGLKPKTRGRKEGEKRSLTKEQEKKIIGIITDKCPDQIKLKFFLWTRDAVKELIQREFGIDMPVRTVGDYLARWGFTVQRPAKQSMDQKPEAVQKWLHEEYPAIHEEAKKEGAEIYWGDETAVQNTANYARGYAPKGETPTLKIKSQKMHINMLSAISSRGKVHFMLSKDSIDTDKLIEFMEKLLKEDDRKIFLILDNLRAHHSKKTTAWAEDYSERIRIFFLPAYSPECNPDEYLNCDLKRSIGTRAPVKSEDELQDRTDSWMKDLSEDPEHVKSYFDHPKLKQYEEIKL